MWYNNAILILKDINMTRKIDYAVTYRFEKELLDKITVKAEELNINKNALVRQILSKALKNVKVKAEE